MCSRAREAGNACSAAVVVGCRSRSPGGFRGTRRPKQMAWRPLRAASPLHTRVLLTARPTHNLLKQGCARGQKDAPSSPARLRLSAALRARHWNRDDTEWRRSTRSPTSCARTTRGSCCSPARSSAQGTCCCLGLRGPRCTTAAAAATATAVQRRPRRSLCWRPRTLRRRTRPPCARCSSSSRRRRRSADHRRRCRSSTWSLGFQGLEKGRRRRRRKERRAAAAAKAAAPHGCVGSRPTWPLRCGSKQQQQELDDLMQTQHNNDDDHHHHHRRSRCWSIR